MNPLYLIIHFATGYFKEENGEKEENREKYLILDLIEKYEEVFSGINQKLKRLMVGKKCFMMKIIA